MSTLNKILDFYYEAAGHNLRLKKLKISSDEAEELAIEVANTCVHPADYRSFKARKADVRQAIKSGQAYVYGIRVVEREDNETAKQTP